MMAIVEKIFLEHFQQGAPPSPTAEASLPVAAALESELEAVVHYNPSP